MAAVASCDIPQGSYMFPCANSPEEMQSEAFQKRYDAGPRGVITILPKVNMGMNLGLTALYYLAVSFFLGYLASLALKPGADFLSVFRFVFTAGFLALLAALVPQAIWFRPRIVGHVIDSVVFAAIAAVLFAALWPSA